MNKVIIINPDGSINRTYASYNLAMIAANKAIGYIHSSGWHVIIAAVEGGRFTPIFLPRAEQVQEGIQLARAGFKIVRI